MNSNSKLWYKTGSVKKHIIFSFLITISFIICYNDILHWIFIRYTNPDTYYSHGFLVPLITGYLIWQKREEISMLPVEPSFLGLGLMILSVLIHFAGTILYIFSISGISIFLFIFGATLFLFGRKITQTLVFPLVFLIFMLPLPISIIEAVSYPMKMLVAKVGVEVVRIMGIPVLRDGFHITIPAGSLLVGNPCSGLRSLISFLAIGSILAYMTPMSRIRKWILFSLSFPVALLSNMVRVSMLVLISNYWGLAAASPDTLLHTASGVFVFVIGFAALFYAGRILSWEN